MRIPFRHSRDYINFGGSGRIRTYGSREGTTVFKTVAINRSATLPNNTGGKGRIRTYSANGDRFTVCCDSPTSPLARIKQKGSFVSYPGHVDNGSVVAN